MCVCEIVFYLIIGLKCFSFMSVSQEKELNLTTFTIPDDNFSLLDAMIMLWVDTALYMLIAWYVDNINPGDAGVARPPWFPFMVSYM